MGRRLPVDLPRQLDRRHRPQGCFAVVHRADPAQHIFESNENNNVVLEDRAPARSSRARSTARARRRPRRPCRPPRPCRRRPRPRRRCPDGARTRRQGGLRDGRDARDRPGDRAAPGRRGLRRRAVRARCRRGRTRPPRSCARSARAAHGVAADVTDEASLTAAVDEVAVRARRPRPRGRQRRRRGRRPGPRGHQRGRLAAHARAQRDPPGRPAARGAAAPARPRRRRRGADRLDLGDEAPAAGAVRGGQGRRDPPRPHAGARARPGRHPRQRAEPGLDPLRGRRLGARAATPSRRPSPRGWSASSRSGGWARRRRSPTWPPSCSPRARAGSAGRTSSSTARRTSRGWPGSRRSSAVACRAARRSTASSRGGRVPGAVAWGRPRRELRGILPVSGGIPRSSGTAPSRSHGRPTAAHSLPSMSSWRRTHATLAAPHPPRSAARRTLPLAVLGSSAANSTMRGYL